MTSAAVEEKRGTIHTRFGRFEHGAGDVVAMVEPLAGFETCRQYVLLSPPEIAPLVCLQGLDGARPSFIAVAAHLADPSFSCAPTAAEWDRLGLSKHQDPESPPLWLALVRVGPDQASANLRAPVVINSVRMVGLQLVPLSSSYSTEHPLLLG